MREPTQLEMIELLPEEDQRKIALVRSLFERAWLAVQEQFDEMDRQIFLKAQTGRQ